MLFVTAYLGLLGLALLGVALLFALRLVYGTRPIEGTADEPVDSFLRGLTLVAWLLIFTGFGGLTVCMLGAGSIVLVIAASMVVAMTAVQFARTERQVFMHLIGNCARRGIALEDAAAAYGQERSGGLAIKAQILAEYLNEGRGLHESLHASGIHNTAELEVAMRVGDELGLLGPLLEDATQTFQGPAAELRRSFHKLFYLSLIIVATLLLASFVLQFIVPRYGSMITMFAMEVPPLSEWAIATGQTMLDLWYLMTPLFGLLAIGMLVAVSAFMGLLPTNFPLVNRFSQRFDRAHALMVLARVVESRISIGQALDSLVRNHPRTVFRARVQLALDGVRAGASWIDAMRLASLVNAREAELLRAAERADNLFWALRETALAQLRHLEYRLRCLLGICFPLLLIAIAIVIGLIVSAIFIPLPMLIKGLA